MAGEWDGRGVCGAEEWGHILMAAILGAVLPGDRGSQWPSPLSTEGLMAVGCGRAAPAQCHGTAASPSSSTPWLGRAPQARYNEGQECCHCPGAALCLQHPTTASLLLQDGTPQVLQDTSAGTQKPVPNMGMLGSPWPGSDPSHWLQLTLPRTGSCSVGAQWGDAGQALGC